MIEFIFNFVISMALITLSFVYWDTVETHVMDIGEKIDEVREAIAAPNASKAKVMNLAEPLIVSALVISVIVAFINTFF